PLRRGDRTGIQGDPDLNPYLGSSPTTLQHVCARQMPADKRPGPGHRTGVDRRSVLREPLDDGSGAESTAAAHGGQAVAPAAALQPAERTVDQDHARATGGVAKGDGPAVRVDLVHVR